MAIEQFVLGRYIALEHIISGIQKTGIPLVKYNGTHFIPSMFDEDVGLFVIIPQLVTKLGISLDQAIYIFNQTTSFLSTLIAITGFWMLYKAPLTRIVAILGVLYATQISFMTNDVYRFPAAVTIAVVPWALYFFWQTDRIVRPQHLFLILTGITFGVTHYIRAHGATPALLFLLVVIGTSWNVSWFKKTAACCLLGFGFLLPHWYFLHCMHQYQAFAKKEFPQFSWEKIHPHPFWHTAYWGLGYIQNNFGLRTEDKTSLDKIRSINPDLFIKSSIPGFPEVQFDDRYEAIMRSEYFKFVLKYPHYTLENYFAKLGTCMVYLLRYGLLGVITFAITGLPIIMTGAFALSALWALLPGLVAVPSVAPYMLTFIVLCILFTIICLNHYLQVTGFIKIKNSPALPETIGGIGEN